MKLRTNRDLLFGLAAVFVAIGMIVTTYVLTWEVLKNALDTDVEVKVTPALQRLLLGGGAFVVIGIVIGTWAILGSRQDAGNRGHEKSQEQFGGALVGLGYVFLLDGIVNLIAFSGFASVGILPQLFPFGQESSKHTAVPDLL